jgi:alanine-glyoxylate transaminase/serine-glyoxylate transaminase/serine-pyruvate transaminase
LDGVCSLRGEELNQDEWELDVVLTASSKKQLVYRQDWHFDGSESAMQVWENRKTPVPNYYADWSNWLPIMKAYERRPLVFWDTSS